MNLLNFASNLPTYNYLSLYTNEDLCIICEQMIMREAQTTCPLYFTTQRDTINFLWSVLCNILLLHLRPQTRPIVSFEKEAEDLDLHAFEQKVML